MKKAIFIISFFVSTFTFSQDTNTIPQTYEDSLRLAYQMIDDLDLSNLTKQKERFTYKVRTESYQLNVEILAYIEKRIKLLSK